MLPPQKARDYRVEPPELRLALLPGDDLQVLVTLVPIVRHIRFKEGGTLEPVENR